jgi:hypothetical protein
MKSPGSCTAIIEQATPIPTPIMSPAENSGAAQNGSLLTVMQCLRGQVGTE